jgi:hypothetical protein
MKSPFTGGPIRLEKKTHILTQGKEEFRIVYYYYLCVDTGQHFTTDEIDNINLRHVYHEGAVKRSKRAEKIAIVAAVMAAIALILQAIQWF